MPQAPQLVRSITGTQLLLPAVRPGISKDYLPEIPQISASQWTFGHGSVIYTIWPAVIVQTAFAAAVVAITQETSFKLQIPAVMLTVLGVVIGFVISYRAISGYDRYWMGRTIWTDMIKNARTMSRLIHFHVPVRLTPKTAEELQSGEAKRSENELAKATAEKRLALDLVAGFCFAVKHHLRGELGIYYEDLYELVKPLHNHDPLAEEDLATNGAGDHKGPHPTIDVTSPVQATPSSSFPTMSANAADYGAVGDGSSSLKHRQKRPDCETEDENQPLLPAEMPSNQTGMKQSQANLIPFGLGRVYNWFARLFRRAKEEERTQEHPHKHRKGRRWQGPLLPRVGQKKGAPRSTGSGENLPLEITRIMSEWCSVLEDRNTVPGGSMGSILGCIASFEGSLTSLEMILGTPLPFVYSAHIRHTVWIYLFFLPNQLVDDFGYYTILGVAIASFIYLGFLAAGDELESPFSYDENDLDLDLFCREIISDEIEVLKRSQGLNTFMASSKSKSAQRMPSRRSMTLVDLSEWDHSHNYAEGTIEGTVTLH